MTIEAGAELDIVTPAELRKELQTWFDRKPIRRNVIGSAVMPTPTASTVIDLGGPPQGYRWQTRLIVLSGIDPLTAEAGGTGAAFIGTASPITGTSNLFDPLELIGLFAAVPASLTFNNEQAIVQGTQHLYVVCKGVAQTKTVAATATVFVEPLLAHETYVV